MTRTTLLSAVLVAAITPAALGDDDQKPDGGKTPKSSGASPAKVPASAAPASPDQLKGVLGEALKCLDSDNHPEPPQQKGGGIEGFVALAETEANVGTTQGLVPEEARP
ncbi:MAG: hypothetical protein ACLQIB_07980, partial [Isosphaeraceae bacterium]